MAPGEPMGGIGWKTGACWNFLNVTDSESAVRIARKMNNNLSVNSCIYDVRSATSGQIPLTIPRALREVDLTTSSDWRTHMFVLRTCLWIRITSFFVKSYSVILRLTESIMGAYANHRHPVVGSKLRSRRPLLQLVSSRPLLWRRSPLKTSIRGNFYITSPIKSSVNKAVL